MKLQSFHYHFKNGWSVKHFPNLDSENTLIIVFSAPELIENPAPLAELASHYPLAKIIGCSSAGEISGPRIVDNCLSVAIIKLENTRIEIVKAALTSTQDSLSVGEKIATSLHKEDLRGLFILSAGLNLNGTELVRGLNTIQNGNISITGGLASDSKDYQQTWAIFAGKIYQNHIVGVGFYGKHIQIGHGARGGWDIYGAERCITKSKNNIIYELDDVPALAFYKKCLGEKAKELPAAGLHHPFGIRQNLSDTKQLVRSIIAVDESEQALICAGDMPKGYLVQLLHTNVDKLIAAADEASAMAIKRMHVENSKPTPVLAIAISCVGRRLLLGAKAQQETELTLASLPLGTQQIGFYAYGQLSPYAIGTCELHNQTMTLTTICEV